MQADRLRRRRGPAGSGDQRASAARVAGAVGTHGSTSTAVDAAAGALMVGGALVTVHAA